MGLQYILGTLYLYIVSLFTQEKKVLQKHCQSVQNFNSWLGLSVGGDTFAEAPGHLSTRVRTVLADFSAAERAQC